MATIIAGMGCLELEGCGAVIEVGNYARDKLTGLHGLITAHTNWLYRTGEYALVREGVDNNGEPWPLLWLDAARLERTDRDGALA